MTRLEPLAHVQWRMSSFCGGSGAGNGGGCVEMAALPDGRIAVRNSNHRDAAAVYFTRPEMASWIKGIKSGEFDDLA
jgi:hypothetical protein